MKKAPAAILFLLLSGCAIADRSDKFGAEFELGLGGVLAYAIDIQLKASVGFSKTCPQEVEAHEAMAKSGDGPGRGRRGFL